MSIFRQASTACLACADGRHCSSYFYNQLSTEASIHTICNNTFKYRIFLCFSSPRVLAFRDMSQTSIFQLRVSGGDGQPNPMQVFGLSREPRLPRKYSHSHKKTPHRRTSDQIQTQDCCEGAVLTGVPPRKPKYYNYTI